MRFAALPLALAMVLGSFSAAQAQDKWLVGQSAPLSGGNAKFGQDIQSGAQAWFSQVNAAGGVQGKPVELLTMDDKNDRKLAGENTTVLLENKNLLALFGYASATLSLDALPQAQSRSVAFFAPFSGANAVRVNSPVLFTMRASYGEEIDKMLSLWTSMGLKRVVVVHYDDEVGKQNYEVTRQTLKKINLEPQSLAIKRNTALGKAEAQALIALQPEVVINTVVSGAAAQLQKELVAMGKVIPTSSLSFVGAEQYIAAAGPASAGTSIAQVVPSPTSSMPAVRECAKALEVAGSKAPMNTTQLESCFAARVLVEGIRRAKKPVTAQSVLEALSNLGSYDLGGFKVSFGPDAHHGSKFVELALVTKDGKLVSR